MSEESNFDAFWDHIKQRITAAEEGVGLPTAEDKFDFVVELLQIALDDPN